MRGKTNKGGRSNSNSSAKRGNKVEKKKVKFESYKQKFKKGGPVPNTSSEGVRLNKYLAQAGVASRREADVMIENGLVEVNGKVVTEFGVKVMPGDEVKFAGENLKTATKRYVLLNKPKEFITTAFDPKGRKTVIDLVKKACKEQLYPIGKLERESTGLVLLTNDSDLEKKLLHPRHESTKLYHVTLNTHFKSSDFKQMLEGIDLEDGKVWINKVSYVDKKEEGKEVGIELKSGKTRVVYRVFESLGYKVTKLDRVMFAGLSKKDLPRGNYRHLTEKEVAFLKMMK
jgi:23S rRNA pseudouridine2605 synthase